MPDVDVKAFLYDFRVIKKTKDEQNIGYNLGFKLATDGRGESKVRNLLRSHFGNQALCSGLVQGYLVGKGVLFEVDLHNAIEQKAMHENFIKLAKMDFKTGFNEGYLMAEHEPKELANLLKTTIDNDYVKGLKAGQKKYNDEQQRIEEAKVRKRLDEVRGRLSKRPRR